MIAAILMLAAAQVLPCPALNHARAWQYDVPQYPHSGDVITVHSSGRHWSAALGSGGLSARWHGDAVELRGSDASYFSGHRTGKGIDGFWIEPKTAFDHSRAFKMRLIPTGPQTWRGTIGAHEERLSLHAWFLPTANDMGDFLVRNPDGLIGDTRFKATVQDCSLALQDVNDAEHRASLHPASDSSARLEGLSANLGTVTLAPQRPPAHSKSNAGDWRTASPESVGLDGRLLEQLFARVEAIDPTNRGVPLIHSILIARHGKLVAEQYFAGYSADQLHELRSASKSFASLLVGAARVHGLSLGSTTPIDSELPGYSAIFAADPAKTKITLGDLLAMRSGLACDDFDDASPGGEDRMQQQGSEADWYRYFLRLPRKAERGTQYAYCSAGTHLAAGVVAGAAGRSALKLFDSWLAAPLGISEYSMPLDPRGRAYFGGGMHLRPRDLLKFGQLLLDHGRWNGRQVVDAAWLNQSTRCPASEPECAEGLGWHFNTVKANGRTYREMEANGNGGQLLMVFPEADLAVVFTAANFNAYPVWRKFREELTPNFILAAIRDQAGPTTLSGRSSPNTR